MAFPDFTAIDFETATGSRNSACAVGIVRYKNGEIIYKDHFYIKPPDNKYSYRNIMVHGIYAKTTANAPTFDIVWKEIQPFIENQLVVAHNASFDRSVLKESLEYYDTLVPEIIWECTYQLTGKNLEDACKAYDIELLNHHNPLDDAISCGNLFLKLLMGYQPKPTYNRTNRKHNSFHEKIPRELHKPDLETATKESPFYNKHIVISGIFRNYTRTEVAKIIHKGGAYIQSAVSGKTDYVLAGASIGPAKKEKAEKLRIPIISEEKFRKMIGDKISKSVILPSQKSLSSEKIELIRAETTAPLLLEGKSFVVSGVFEHHSRDEIKELIERYGGKNTGSISSKTNYLLAGANMGPAKKQKAEKLGVLIISEEEFEGMIGEGQ